MKPLVIYHADCVDGFTAAWVAWGALDDEPDLLAAKYGDAPPDVTDRDVVIVDFSYPRAQLLDMHARAKSLRVFDHHKTAAADLEGLDFCVFDMSRSGAGLVWDHLGPAPEQRPWLVDYVEDRDLWRWALPHSREVSAYIASLTFTTDEWSALAHAPLDRVIAHGAAILRYQGRVVEQHVPRAVECLCAGFVVPVVNATTMISEIGNELALRAPFAAMWFEVSPGLYVYSLRSSAQNPEHVDVAEIAKRYGGGGHKHAAGFTSVGLAHEAKR